MTISTYKRIRLFILNCTNEKHIEVLRDLERLFADRAKSGVISPQEHLIALVHVTLAMVVEKLHEVPFYVYWDEWENTHHYEHRLEMALSLIEGDTTDTPVNGLLPLIESAEEEHLSTMLTENVKIGGLGHGK